MNCLDPLALPGAPACGLEPRLGTRRLTAIAELPDSRGISSAADRWVGLTPEHPERRLRWLQEQGQGPSPIGPIYGHMRRMNFCSKTEDGYTVENLKARGQPGFAGSRHGRGHGFGRARSPTQWRLS